jgi:hypothetical protein
MTFELIGSLAAALACGLFAWALRRSFAWLPGWLAPAAAAAGMLATTISLEYTWFDRVTRDLPEGIAVVDVRRDPSPLRPWTYLAPVTSRFVVLDLTRRAQHPARAELAVLPVVGLARWQNPQTALVVFDCAGGRRVPVVAGMEIDAAGTLTGAEWTVPPTGDELQQAACREG